MALVPGSISAQDAAATLTGEELLAINQEIGPVIAATALVVGNSYRIETLGTTNWAAVGATATPASGNEFRCDAVGTGTGTAQQVVTRRTTTQDVADLAAAGPGSGATNLTYAPATREIDSSTGTGAILPLAGTVVSGQPVAGLQTAADAARVAQLGESGSPIFASLTVTGTATAVQFDGNLTGAVSDHCRNVSGVSLAALTPLYVTGSQGDTTILEVVPARGDTPSLMPAAGLALAALGTSGSAANGHLVATGPIPGVNTAGLTSGAPLYVAPTGGTTATMPTTGLVQVVAIVGRVHANTGTVIVLPGSALPRAAYTGAYGDLSGRPTLGSAAAANTTDFDPAGSASSAITAHLGAVSHLAGDLGNLTNYIVALSNLLLPRAAGTYFQYLSSNSVTNGGSGAAASLFTNFAPSSSSLPTMGRVDSGTSSSGAAGLTHSAGTSWATSPGKLSLQAIRSFQTTIWFISPTTLSGGANTYRIFLGWLDSATYSARNSIGLLINGSALTITSTVAGVESSIALTTIAANTNYKVTVIYDAVAATITANVNGGAYTTFSILSTPTALGMLGVFIVKETGTTSIAFYTSVPQFHAWLSC